MIKQILISLSIFLFLATGTVMVVSYGRGYRFGFDQGKIELSGTGLLVTTSIPDGAQVFINDKLTTATDDTINLFPGEYTIRIVKEGYFPWEKKIKVQKEIVAKADATLFLSAPKLQNITSSGINNPVIDPSYTKLAYTIASNSASKNGVYVLDMTTRLILTLQSASTHIANDTSELFSQAQLSWSPNGQELVATISADLTPTTYLLQSNGYNNNPQDVSATLASVDSDWKKEQAEADKSRLATLKKPVQKLIAEHMNIIAWSPDETKILYQASASATMAIALKPRLLGIESTPETRDLVKDSLYVYDIKEDKNYALPLPKLETRNLKLETNVKNQNSNIKTDSDFGFRISDLQASGLSWMPDSKHILYVQDKKIGIMDLDGTNSTIIYAGPFIDNYVFPWPTGSKVVILTNLGNENILPNLYTIDLE